MMRARVIMFNTTFNNILADFPKIVGPDRQKCSRTDDFKIYIGPNVR